MPLILKKDKARLFKAGAIFLVWIIAVFYIGSTISETADEASKANPKITEAKNPTGYGLSDDEKTPEQKENSEKLVALNRKSVTTDTSRVNKALGMDSQGWETASTKQQDGVPSISVMFPQGQDSSAWRESYVFRSFVNITLKDPLPTVYNVYEQWIKEQVPDIKIEKVEDNSGVTFTGTSAASKFFLSGKVFGGSLNETVHIAQYIIKNDGKPDVEQKAQEWSNKFLQIQ